MSHLSVLAAPDVYDQFEGPDVDPAKWMALPLPLPDGSLKLAVEPSALIVARDGTLSVTVEQFETSHDTVQQADNTKHVVISTQQFPLPRHGVATFSIDQAATRLGGRKHDDLMHALAAFNVLDFEQGLVFDVLSDGATVLAVHEQLPGVPKPAGPTFTHVVHQPFAPVDVAPGVAHHCAIEFDTRTSTVRWLVDGVQIYRVANAPMPERVGFGLGLMSGVLLRGGRSTSIQGQGLNVSWTAPSMTITEG